MIDIRVIMTKYINIESKLLSFVEYCNFKNKMLSLVFQGSMQIDSILVKWLLKFVDKLGWFFFSFATIAKIIARMNQQRGTSILSLYLTI